MNSPEGLVLDGKERRRYGRAIPLDPTRIGKPRHRKKDHLPRRSKKRAPKPNLSTAARSPQGGRTTGEGEGDDATTEFASERVARQKGIEGGKGKKLERRAVVVSGSGGRRRPPAAGPEPYPWIARSGEEGRAARTGGK